MGFVFNTAKQWREDWDSLPASSTVRIALQIDAHLVEITEQDAATVSALSAAFSEPTDASYARLAGTTSVSIDNTNNRVEHRLAKITFPNLAGADDAYGVLVYYDPDDTDTDTTNIPIAYVSFSVIKTTDGSDLEVAFNGADPGAVFYGA